jgi:uncharacterized protein YgiM (DUF1202 family)
MDKQGLNRTLCAWVMGTLLVAAPAAAQEQASDVAQQATPTAPAAPAGVAGSVYQTANLRSGPDSRYAIVGQLAADDPVWVLGRDEGSRWLLVADEDAQEGWLPSYIVVVSGDLASVPVVNISIAEAEADVVVSAYGLVNVRAEPRIDSPIVGQLDRGQTASATARSNENNDWLLIDLATAGAQTGWVAFFTVTVTGNPNNLPVLVPDASGSELIRPSALVQAQFNARLHVEPSLSSDTIAIVPFGSEVTPVARSRDGAWLYVVHEDGTGWGATRLFAIESEAVNALPLYVPGTAPGLAGATPRAALTITPEVTPSVTPPVTDEAAGGT